MNYWKQSTCTATTGQMWFRELTIPSPQIIHTDATGQQCKKYINLSILHHYKQPLRLIIYISVIFLSALLLLGFSLFINPVHITGHLIKNPKDTSAYLNGVVVIVKGDNKVLAYTFTDDKGDFEMTFTPGKEKSFDFFVAAVGIDTMLISSVKTFDSDTPEMNFYLPALKKKNFLGQTICLKCNKADKVYKIRYGDGLPLARRINKNGDTTYSPIVNGYYNAGTCISGLATHYCDRDNIIF